MKIKTVPAFVLFICIAFLSGCVSQNPNAIWFSPNKTAEQEREDMAECRNEARLGTPPDYNQQTLGQAFVTGYFQGQRENTIFTDCMISKGYELETNTPEIKQVLQLKRGMSQVEVVKLLGNPQIFLPENSPTNEIRRYLFPAQGQNPVSFSVQRSTNEICCYFYPFDGNLYHGTVRAAVLFQQNSGAWFVNNWSFDLY